ncbi:chromate efflux transporter [Chitinophaga qingshengii]|uniref:Chromate efflux transporter n=1 Tax=Chitinophaga qingshengii TaxID=1569794 RepID=A0ABR7TNR2_9BACT|nr:chromate efflux transporter [Chitinophaga qingshengii]MBC9932107.1 chromate efflux transporter [Chitinophaga qingshengii]
MKENNHRQRPSFGEALQFWFKLGWISFGGTAGHIAIMHEYLVDRKKWISNSRFLHALNHCMILPGPEAQQLATYVGWQLHGKKGGLAAGILFVLPSMFILLGLSMIYVLYGNVPWIYAMFNGLKPAVVAIIILAMIRVGQKALHTPLHYILAAAAFVSIFWFNLSLLLIIAGTIGIALLVRYIRPAWVERDVHEEEAQAAEEQGYFLNKFTHSPVTGNVAARLFRQIGMASLLWALPFALFFWLADDFIFWKKMMLFFTQTAFVTVGGSYTVLPYVAQFSVGKLNWLSNMQMIDGFALAETTPGPLIIVLSYVGFMAGYNHFNGSLWMGTLGLLTTTFYTFLPCFLFIFAGAPLIEKTQENKSIAGVLGFVTAAVTGVILNLTLFLGKDVLFPGGIAWANLDYTALAWMLLSLFLLIRYRLNVVYLILMSLCFGGLHYLFLQ